MPLHAMRLPNAGEDHGAPKEAATVAASRSNRSGSTRRSACPRAGSAPIVGDYALAVCGDPSDVAAACIVDRRRVAGRRLAADDPPAAIIERCGVAARRRPANALAFAVVERSAR
jgi:hypothetical protein